MRMGRPGPGPHGLWLVLGATGRPNSRFVCGLYGPMGSSDQPNLAGSVRLGEANKIDRLMDRVVPAFHALILKSSI
jgi:hypothetical protein